MLIILKNSALITGVNSEEMRDIKTYLTISNPLFFKKMDLGLSTWNITQDLEYYTQHSDITIEVPMGAMPDIIAIFNKYNNIITKEDIADQRVSNKQQEYFSKLKFKGKLRDYQQEIVDSCMATNMGIVEAQTASGKTITFVALTLLRKEPTLILVHTLELANQTIDSFVKFTNLKKEDIGFIGDGRFEVKPITVGLHQTMAKLEKNKFSLLNDVIGQIIGDEIQNIAWQSPYLCVH